MARGSAFSSLSFERRRARPATLNLTHSAFTKPIECVQLEEAKARASAELEHTQAAFTAALEADPLPSVRARSPTAYRSAQRAIPMELDVQWCESSPLPQATYKFPLSEAASRRPSIGTIKRGNGKACIPWSNVVRLLKGGRRRKGRALPEPLGFHERIKNSGHEWRPENKGVCPTLWT